MVNHKKEQDLRKTRFWIWKSVTRGEGISTPKISSKTIPLIKCAKAMWFFQNI